MILGFEMKRNTLDTINFHHMSIAKQQSSQNPDNHQGFDSASGALIEGCWTHSPQKATPANWLLAESPSTNHHKIPPANWLLAASPSSNHHKILTIIEPDSYQAPPTPPVTPSLLKDFDRHLFSSFTLFERIYLITPLQNAFQAMLVGDPPP